MSGRTPNWNFISMITATATRLTCGMKRFRTLKTKKLFFGALKESNNIQ